MLEAPDDSSERMGRLESFHQSTKYADGAVRPLEPDAAYAPKNYRIFDSMPKVELPTSLIGVDVVATVSLLAHAPEAVPDSELNPPHDLRTLATWLYMSYGFTQRVQLEPGQQATWLRSCPSAGAMYPCEIYVATFNVEGLEPGLYHFGPREYALRKLRGGAEAFAWFARGVGNMPGIERAPAGLIVSTNFWRSAARYGARGYRTALLDAGHLVENIAVAARGLGMDAAVRLRVDDAVMRQLIGASNAEDFSEIETVQAAVVWTNPAEFTFVSNAGTSAPLPPIKRTPLSTKVNANDAIVAAHEDATGPRGIVAGIRPPLTDLSPLPAQVQTYARDPDEGPHGGMGLSMLMQSRRSARSLARKPLPRDVVLWCNRVGFRGGTYPPMHANGDHVALVRGFWVINGVSGIDSGIWYHDAPTDKWAMLARNDTRMEMTYLAMEEQLAGDASAVCFIAANLRLLMEGAGPDLYRLAHLEAGVVAHRMQLAATALGYGARGLVDFYDDEVRRFLGLSQTSWQVLYATAIGVKPDDKPASATGEDDQTQWRG